MFYNTDITFVEHLQNIQLFAGKTDILLLSVILHTTEAVMALHSIYKPLAGNKISATV